LANVFFYGTLRYVPLLEKVLGKPARTIDLSDAALANHAICAVEGENFPMIRPQQGFEARGLLARDLSEQDVERLKHYEVGFDYDLEQREVTLADGTSTEASVFFPEPGVWQPNALWSLEDWVAQWGTLTLLSADEVMAQLGRLDADTLGRSFPAINTRAWARLNARRRESGTHDVTRDVVVQDHKRPYLNYFGMDEIRLQHRQYDGSMGPVLNRSALMQGSAVIVLPYDPVRDMVLLVEQFRTPVFLIDDPNPWMWEPVAGMIDPGETPQEAARREAMEEAHVDLSALECAGGAYSSSGSSTEYVHLYVGLAELTKTVTGAGVCTEGEDIRSKIVPYDQFVQQLDANEFKDLPLLSLAHWLVRHRDRLRAAHQG